MPGCATSVPDVVAAGFPCQNISWAEKRSRQTIEAVVIWECETADQVQLAELDPETQWCGNVVYNTKPP
jgi:site-specific DNA-cytosine methylase